jgi:hypothetical protein
MICCGSGFDFGKFCSDSGSRQYLANLSKHKNIANLAFSISEAAYFPKSSPLIFDLTFFYYILCWIRFQNPVPEQDPDPDPEPYCIPAPVPQKVTVPAVPALRHLCNEL